MPPMMMQGVNASIRTMLNRRRGVDRSENRTLPESSHGGTVNAHSSGTSIATTTPISIAAAMRL